MIELPIPHSPLGASGAYRWMPPPYGGGCYGSVGLSYGVEDPESEYAAEGTAAHALAASRLVNGGDAWEKIGTLSYGIAVSKDMADAVQVYLDAVRAAHPDRNQGNTWVERRFHVASIHHLFYGQADLAHLNGKRLHVWDYKHGAGIVVEVERNPQLMYYAVGMLTDLGLWGQVDEVVLYIAQPRGFHWAGPIRSWTVATKELFRWQHDVLVPAMNKAEVSRDTASGEHCRFCPARFRACPQIEKDADELEGMLKMMNEKGGAPHLTNEQIGRFLGLNEVLKIAAKAARETGFARAEKGAKIPGWKMARARANREWKKDAEAKAREAFGNDAFTVPELKSPAQIDALPLGKSFTAREAFKPDAGLQLVPERDSRQEAGPSARSMFEPVGKKPGRRRSKP